MALSTQFERELDDLFWLRTAGIRRTVAKKRGRVPRLGRDRLRKKIARVESIARAILIRNIGRAEFKDAIVVSRRWHPKRGKGYGVAAKKASFRSWYETEIESPNCVYAFWAKKRCQYVGKTGRGGRRPSAHLEKFWFGRVTRVDVHVVARASDVSKVECLAIDMYEPSRNKIRSAKKAYAKKCPVCTRSREIRRDLRKLFRLRA